MVVVIYIIGAAILIFAGLMEKRTIRKSIEKIEIRVNVNGIRGKSTATRFITAILQEAGYRVVGKTTGTSARMIFWNKEEEETIKRRPIGPNIGEQTRVLKRVADMGVDALVCECMAVNPEYQDVYQNQIIQANIVVITNVVEDHLDEMGPTTEQIAWAFAKTIPERGILVITEGPYADYFKKVAKKKHTKVVCVDPSWVDEEYTRQFPYMVFQNNCAIGAGFAYAMGIDMKLAVQAMLKAHPDPGAAQIVKVNRNNRKCWLVNAFAANEPTSSLEIWKNIQNYGFPLENQIVLLNCRDDRVDRSKQFAQDFLPNIKVKTLIVIGSGTLGILNSFRKNEFPDIEECIDMTKRKSDELIAEVEQLMENNIIFCVGNIHGQEAEEFLENIAGIAI